MIRSISLLSVLAAFTCSEASAQVLFSDDFEGPAMSSSWQASMPNMSLAGYSMTANYLGAPTASFEAVGDSSVLRMRSTLFQLQRRGWTSTGVFSAPGFRYEVRFNTLNQSDVTSIDSFIEIGLLDAANNARYDITSPYGGIYSTYRQFAAGSSIDNYRTIAPFNYLNNTWYRLVLEAAPGENFRASLMDDSGVELIGRTFSHGADAYTSGFRLVLSQAMGLPERIADTDVAVDYVRLTLVPEPGSGAFAICGLVVWRLMRRRSQS